MAGKTRVRITNTGNLKVLVKREFFNKVQDSLGRVKNEMEEAVDFAYTQQFSKNPIFTGKAKNNTKVSVELKKDKDAEIIRIVNTVSGTMNRAKRPRNYMFFVSAGLGSNAKYGPRPVLNAAIGKFVTANNINDIIK